MGGPELPRPDPLLKLGPARAEFKAEQGSPDSRHASRTVHWAKGPAHEQQSLLHPPDNPGRRRMSLPPLQ